MEREIKKLLYWIDNGSPQNKHKCFTLDYNQTLVEATFQTIYCNLMNPFDVDLT